ncbi:MAG: hypothetical protein GY805_40075 [Chloroflexi bacterium]|nr:hypothetical protein [Chloroflexota bacterium]
MERAKFVKPAGLDTEIRIARSEFLGAYEAYHKQVTGFRGLLRQAGSLAFHLPTYDIYEKIGMTAVFMSLCDKALGETALLRDDVKRAKEAFVQYANRLEGIESLEIGPDVDMEYKEKAYEKIRARQNKEKVIFEKLCDSLLKTV